MRRLLWLAVLGLGLWLMRERWANVDPRRWVSDRVDCDPSYPTVCISPPPPVLGCDDVRARGFKVFGADPHGLDPDRDGVGCEAAGLAVFP
jgi:hypothetical protein